MSFKNSTKTQSGHSFPSKFGFSGSSGEVATVKPYVRKARSIMKKAEGGSVDKAKTALGDLPARLKEMKGSMDKVSDKVVKKAKGGPVYSPQKEGNAVTLRDDPLVEIDKEYGGKGPLRPGFKKGGFKPFQSKPKIGK